jgi:sterol desaturase/sphingolipid hydroxylase (fatty acid hydroxylase superfamily)
LKPPADDRHSESDHTNPSPDWSALIGRLADSLVRLFRAELLLLEQRLSQNVSNAIGDVVTRTAAILILVSTSIVGLICLLGAYILLLSRWLPPWQAWGIGGLTIIVIGLLIFVILNSRMRRRE